MTKGVPLFLSLFLAGCAGHSSKDHVRIEKFTVCVPNEKETAYLKELVLNVAETQRAQIFDRSKSVKRELSDLKETRILRMTIGDPVMVTIKRDGKFRLFLSNLGSEKRVTLDMDSSGTRRPPVLTKLVNEVRSRWDVRVELEQGEDSSWCV